MVEFVGARSVEAGGDGVCVKKDPSSQKFEWCPRPGAGLVNVGNSCFVNATLQCLAHCQQLAEEIFERKGKTERALRETIFGILTKRKFVPKRILSMLEDFGFVRHRQEDAHEFLRRLLDSVELNQGTLRSSLRCPKCHYSTENIEKFSDISLEPKRSLERSLSAFFSKEILDFQNMWQCSRCEEKVRAVKTLDIQQHPHTLVVHLKRYGRGRTGTKLARHVAFPHKLFLHSQLYNLRAILVHDGTTTRSGHYSAYVKDAEDSWYLFDDDLVAKVSPGHVFRQQAYILFYAKTQSKLLASTFHAQSPLKFFHKRNKRKKFQLAFIYPPPPIAPQTQETKTETNTFFDLKRDDEQQLDTTKYRYDYWDRALDAPRKSKRLKQG